jgi:hypothetical protein
MKAQYNRLSALIVVLTCSAAMAEDPAYYVKKGTWQETMRASRQALIGFEDKRAGCSNERAWH